jgi:hypothetical protein
MRRMVYGITTKTGKTMGHLYYRVQIASMSSGRLSLYRSFRNVLTPTYQLPVAPFDSLYHITKLFLENP